MTTKAVEIQTDGVMTLIAETLSARVASSATVEADFSPVAVTNELFSNLLQKFHVMEPHKFCVSNAFLILRIRPLEERLRGIGTDGEDAGDETVSKRKQNNQNRSRHYNTPCIAVHCSADFHIVLRFNVSSNLSPLLFFLFSPLCPERRLERDIPIHDLCTRRKPWQWCGRGYGRI